MAPTAFQACQRHAFAHAALFEKSFFKMFDLPVQQVVGLVD